MTKEILRVLLLGAVIGAYLPSLAGATCGDGMLDLGESCDLGAGNGTATTCCTTLCEFRAIGFTCRSAAGVCDLAETCTGADANCPMDAFKASDVQCRAAAGECDMPETCSGSGSGCPTDAFRPAGTVCRAPSGSCDITENCDGASRDCPSDAVEPAGTGCRPATGDCDVAESCDGSAGTCPPDAVEPAGTECRPGTGTCDPPETCDGSAVACPADAFAPDGTECSDGSTCTDNDACFRGVCVGTTNLDACLDDFLCYRSKQSSGEPKFAPITGIHLVDQFEDVTYALTKARNLCLPADKNAEGTIDAVTHLASYSLALAAGSPRHVPQQNVLVTNQLGFIRVNTIKADLLLVPTAKSLASQPPAPDPESHGVDHYKCYKVHVTPGTPRFPERVIVTATDQFNAATKTLKLVKPRHLCTPVDKDGSGVKHPTVHLMCYVTHGSPRTAQRRGVFVTDELGARRIDTGREREICIPSEKSLS
jgi:hypothetical protein